MIGVSRTCEQNNLLKLSKMENGTQKKCSATWSVFGYFYFYPTA